MSDDLISRQAAISLAKDICVPTADGSIWRHRCIDPDKIRELPSAEPKIIHGNACKHWKQTCGKMKGFGLGECDNFGIKLVTCNGFCFWAERREDERFN